MDVGGGEPDAEGFACGVEGEEEGDGVCAAGDGDAEAVAGLDVGAVEGKGGCWHDSVTARVIEEGGDFLTAEMFLVLRGKFVWRKRAER